MFTKKSIDEVISEISSSKAVPGGGTVAALSATLASALGVMSSNLTITNKKYALVEKKMKEIKNSLEDDIAEFKKGAEKDSSAFEKVIASLKLPQGSEEENKTRDRKIDEALEEAIEVPLGLMKICNEVMNKLDTLEEEGNQNSLSDVGTAAALVLASAQGMYYVILQNYDSAKEKADLDSYIEQAENSAKEILDKSNKINEKILRKLSQ